MMRRKGGEMRRGRGKGERMAHYEAFKYCGRGMVCHSALTCSKGESVLCRVTQELE